MLLTGLSTGTVALGEVTTLDHEVLDDTVEGGTLVAETLLASGQGAEVLSGLGGGLAIQANDDAAQGLIAVLDVKVDLVSDLGALDGLGGRAEEQHRQADEKRRGDEKAAEAEHCVLFLSFLLLLEKEEER